MSKSEMEQHKGHVEPESHDIRRGFLISERTVAQIKATISNAAIGHRQDTIRLSGTCRLMYHAELE